MIATPTMIYPRLRRSRTFCQSLFSFMLRACIVFIGTVHLWLVINDKQRQLDNATSGKDVAGYERFCSSGYDVVIVTNLFLIIGAILDWYLLIAFWIVIYAFIIIYASAKYLATGVFPWTPGISPTASYAMAENMNMMHRVSSPTLAIMFTLSNFLMVFIIFLLTAVMDMHKKMDKGPGLPVAIKRNQTQRALRNNENHSATDGLPTYSDIDHYDHCIYKSEPIFMERPTNV